MLAPESLLIYYGWPNAINGSDTSPAPVDAAAKIFGRYDNVVLGAGLEKEQHGAHGDTRKIIGHRETSNTKFFGYVDLGVSTSNFPAPEIQKRIDSWKEMGVRGIFLDDFGYDFGVTRKRQNDAVGYIHSKKMTAVVNAWNPDDVFGIGTHGKYNPEGLRPQVMKDDFFLCESYQITQGSYQTEKEWQSKVNILMEYQKSHKFGIWSVTTPGSENDFEEKKFLYSWYSALIYGFDAAGWGEFNFSADNTAPWRERPNHDFGKKFKGDVIQKASNYFRKTNTGTIRVDAVLHRAGFEGK